MRSFGKSYIKRLWNAAETAKDGSHVAPAFPESRKITGVRATLRGSPWTSIGFSPSSAGMRLAAATSGAWYRNFGGNFLRAHCSFIVIHTGAALTAALVMALVLTASHQKSRYG